MGIDSPAYFIGGFTLSYPSGLAPCLPLNEAAYHSLSTYHRPLIVSAGPETAPLLHKALLDLLRD